MPEHSVAPEKRGKAGGVRAGATLGSAVAAAGSVGLSGHSGPQRHPFFLHRAHLLEEFGRLSSLPGVLACGRSCSRRQYLSLLFLGRTW